MRLLKYLSVFTLMMSMLTGCGANKKVDLKDYATVSLKVNQEIKNITLNEEADKILDSKLAFQVMEEVNPNPKSLAVYANPTLNNFFSLTTTTTGPVEAGQTIKVTVDVADFCKENNVSFEDLETKLGIEIASREFEITVE